MTVSPAPGSDGSDLEAATRDVVHRMFGRDTAYLLLWAVQLLGAAALTPVISRLLAVSAFGQVAAVNAVMQVLFVLAGLGLANALQRTYAQGAAGPEDALRLMSLLVLAAAVLTAAADLTGRWWGPALGFDGYPQALHLAVLWGGVSAPTAGCLALLRSQDRLAAFATVSLLQSVVAEALAVTLIVVQPATASRFILGQLLAQLAALFAGLFFIRPRLLRLRDRSVVRAALLFGLPIVPATLGTFVLNAADRLVVQNRLGEVAVARYQVAYNVGSMPMLLLGVLFSSWMPRLFALQDPATRSAVLAASRDTLYRLLCPVLVGLSLGAPLVLRVWTPPRYHPEQLLVVTAVVIVSAVPYTAGLAASRTLLSAGRSRAVALSTLVAAVVNVALNLLLVPSLRLTGSALATLFSYAVLHAILLRSVPRELRVPPPTRRALGELLACASVALLVAKVLPVSVPVLVLRALASSACLAWLVSEVLRASGRQAPALRMSRR